jgi:hypothetical protein
VPICVPLNDVSLDSPSVLDASFALDLRLDVILDDGADSPASEFKEPVVSFVSVPDSLEVAEPSSDRATEDSWLRASEVSLDSSVSVLETKAEGEAKPFEYCNPKVILATRINKKGNIIPFFVIIFTSFYNYANY